MKKIIVVGSRYGTRMASAFIITCLPVRYIYSQKTHREPRAILSMLRNIVPPILHPTAMLMWSTLHELIANKYHAVTMKEFN